jgi:hypothetical protein
MACPGSHRSVSASRKATPMSPESPHVRQTFRHILLWPQVDAGARLRRLLARQPWQLLADMGEASPWREVVDEYSDEAVVSLRAALQRVRQFCCLYVQRFLYGTLKPSGTGTTVARWMWCFVMAINTLRVASRIRRARHARHRPCRPVGLFWTWTWCCSSSKSAAVTRSLSQAQRPAVPLYRAQRASWDTAGHAQHCFTASNGWATT